VELQGAESATLQSVGVVQGPQLNQEDPQMEDENMVLVQDLNVMVHPEIEEEPPAPMQEDVIPPAAIIAPLALNINNASIEQNVPLESLQPLEVEIPQ
jgi:hypothetical protein